MSRFGSWTSPRHVELAFIHLVNKWLPTYIAEAERQFGIPPRSLPVPARGQFTVSRQEFIKWPENQTPAILVLAPGLAGDTRREADRSVTAPVAVGFGVITAASVFGAEGGESAATEVAQIIGVAIREIVLRLPPDDVSVAGIELLDEQYGDIEERNMGSSRVIFRVWVRNWGSGSGGPIDRNEPPEDPYDPPGDLPTVEGIYLTMFNARRID